jgi:hypothetical protein
LNIEDIKVKIACPKLIIPAIFEHQRTLMQKYDQIETRNGIHVPELPGHIDNRCIQYRLKDMFWRFTEELTEAAEELSIHRQDFIELKNWITAWDQRASIQHFFEEFVDALHFLTEASIIANLAPDLIQLNMEQIMRVYLQDGTVFRDFDDRSWSIADVIQMSFFNTIQTLGLAANCLKNKPWKMTEMSTDITRFRGFLYSTWDQFFITWGRMGGSIDLLYILYAKKNQVNQWRQKTNY